jgi:molecular chaperone DnaK (HSP70)
MTQAASRYVVGIDLGTTNTAVAYLDTADGDAARVVPFPLTQTVAPGLVEARPTLPSFLYVAPEGERAALALPWEPAPSLAVGEHARTRGGEVPARLVASAKSWLCNPAVDRQGAILPWGAGDDVPKISPVDASAAILRHVAAAWAHAGHPPLAGEDVLVTVPASFDAVARELTVEAARRAGLPRVTLLEEPQAAFYSYLAHAGDAWRTQLGVGDVVLVCDVGGGTTDFTLIAVGEADGDLVLERIAVGDHILLGGDNMDLALAYALAQKIGQKLDAWQQRSLTLAARAGKEQLLAGAAERVPVAILGRGTRLIGGTIKTELARDEVERVLVDGFFPFVGAGDHPQRSRRTGILELGLPYASDAAVTRHLAEFVARHGRRPTAVLYNGGVMKGAALRRRLHEAIAAWGAPGPRQLGGTDPDLAVAHGAAYYGGVRRGRGVRIRGGVARSYYIGVETAMPAVPGMPPPLRAVCVVPFGTEEGTEANLPDQEFGLVVGEPAEFRFLGSSVRKTDRLGDIVDDLDDIDELAPLETTLPVAEDAVAGTVVPVRLRSHVTPVGTLELWCVAAGGKRWKLEINVRT